MHNLDKMGDKIGTITYFGWIFQRGRASRSTLIESGRPRQLQALVPHRFNPEIGDRGAVEKPLLTDREM